MAKSSKQQKSRATGHKAAMKTKLKKKPQRRGPKLGPAATLPGQEWTRWLNHVCKTGSCWLFVALLFTHLLCLRITEALRLKSSDFCFTASNCSVFVGPLKRQASVRKPLLKQTQTVLKRLKEVGIKQKRVRNAGARGQQVFWDVWKWPKTSSGYLFPAERVDSVKPYRTKDAVSKAISKLRQGYARPVEGVIRSHSGRHSMINLLKTLGIAEAVGMQFARISNPQVYKKYGNMTEVQLAAALKKSKSLQTSLATQYKGLVLGKK